MFVLVFTLTTDVRRDEAYAESNTGIQRRTQNSIKQVDEIESNSLQVSAVMCTYLVNVRIIILGIRFRLEMICTNDIHIMLSIIIYYRVILCVRSSLNKTHNTCIRYLNAKVNIIILMRPLLLLAQNFVAFQRQLSFILACSLRQASLMQLIISTLMQLLKFY